MNKERIIEILEDYEYFVDDDYGGSYQHINCSQRACTPIGILQILDYIDKLESNRKALKEWLIEQRKYDYGEDKYGDTLDKMKELEKEND